MTDNGINKTILACIVKGLDDETISRKLGVELNEVKNETGKILKKYNTDTKIKAAIRAIKQRDYEYEE